MRDETIDAVYKISDEPNAFEQIENKFSNIPLEKLAAEIVEVGIMPEVFDHDSSEEKLWSKLSDIILAGSLNYLGLQAEVLRTRGNSADVFARATTYTLVSDAKCFRLSRTAKNQKDFKVKALDDWRRQDTYALLVSPLYQYPIDKSQIYPQAISRNVTLLSYTHLKFLLEKTSKPDLVELWETGRRLSEKYSSSEQQRGLVYWQEVDDTVRRISGVDIGELKRYKLEEIDKTKQLGQEGIRYWKNKIDSFSKLSREEAIRLLVKAEKIEQKILTIERVISKNYIV
jgi:type II restriction enzyme